MLMSANMHLAKSHEKQSKTRSYICQTKGKKKKKVNYFVSAKTWITIATHDPLESN